MKVYPKNRTKLIKQYPDASFYPPEFWDDESDYSSSWCGTPGCRGGSPYGPDFCIEDDGTPYWVVGWSCACGCEDRDFVFYDGMEDWEGM